jgi:hypothetical protein
MALGSVAQAADISGYVIGTDYNTIMSRYWSTINNNVANGGHYVQRVAPYDCNWSPSGRASTCQLIGVLFDEFISNPTCAGRADCAFSSTLIFGAKHKGAWQLIGNILQGITIAQYTWELYNWCANTPVCIDPCPQCVLPQPCDGEGVMIGTSCDGGPLNPFLQDLSNYGQQGFDELMINYYTGTNRGIGYSPDGLGPWGLDSEEPMPGGSCPDPGILICL